MNKLLVIAGWALLLSVPCIAEADTLFTTPVIYTPSGAAADTQTVKFTGGGGAKARVTGKLAGSAK